MKEQFQLLADAIDNARFSCQDFKISKLNGSRLPVRIYNVEVPFREYLIKISNELGVQNSGHASLQINGKQIPDFEIRGRNHFVNLFFRKKEMLKINCEDMIYKELLYESCRRSGLENIAKENAFEPRIYVDQNGENAVIRTEYHLEFDDKIGAVKALIEFYKNIINFEWR